MSGTQANVVLTILGDGRWHSTLEIIERGVLRPAARVHELRRDGFPIETRNRGRGIHQYRLTSSERCQPASPTAAPLSAAAPAAIPLGASCFLDGCLEPPVALASGQWWCEQHGREEVGR